MQNANAAQQVLLEQLRQAAGAVEVAWDDERGVARSIRGVLAAGDVTPEQVVARFLAARGALFGPAEGGEWLTPLSEDVDAWNWTHRQFQQRYATHGRLLDVWGARLAAHFDPSGVLREVQSSCWRDVAVDATPQIDADALRKIVKAEAEKRRGFGDLERQLGTVPGFPLMEPPHLVVYPWQKRFRLAWTTSGYVGPELEAGEIFVDAVTGELFLFSPLGMHAEVPAVGSGRGVTPVAPLGGPYVLRNPLDVVQDTTSGHFYLKDTTHVREIITFDAALAEGEAAIAAGLAAAAGDLPGVPLAVSTNATNAWQKTVPSFPRDESQQPEVDAHYLIARIYEWYDALEGGAGRAGWDDGKHSNPPVKPNMPVRIVAHVGPPNTVDAGFRAGIVGDHWYPFILLHDCDPASHCPTDTAPPPNRALDYFAGSGTVLAHEYQHGITTFSFRNHGTGRPGFGAAGWAGALHEGLADAFGALYSNVWGHGPEISTAGLVIRNAAFPRDPSTWDNLTGGRPCGLGRQDRDHFADRTAPPAPPNPDTDWKYRHATILSHCAYLMSRGGVQQHFSRVPVLVPVQGLGHQPVGGKALARTARIWYLGLTRYLSNVGAMTGLPATDETMFRTLRDACVSAAEAIYGAASRESATTKLAFYAVGLQPPGVPYGPDVTFLRWGHDWVLSRPHLGGVFATCPDWASLDLFIDNGGGFAWTALVNTVDAFGNPTQFENTIYCRVRNVGDQTAQNVVVDLHYAKLGTVPTGWQPVTDVSGVVQQINVGTLAAGQSSFSDAAQWSPPASASARWYIPPLAPGDVVGHFCLRARVTAVGDVNVHNNEVQSNLAHVVYQPNRVMNLAFVVGNPTGRPLPLELETKSELPPMWDVEIQGDHAVLAPGEQRTMRLRLQMGAHPLEALVGTFNATLTGDVRGAVAGRVRGAFLGARHAGARLRGRVALAVDEIGTLTGDFDGEVTDATGEATGEVSGWFDDAPTGSMRHVGVLMKVRVRPWRRVHVTQMAGPDALGGFSVQVEPPP